MVELHVYASSELGPMLGRGELLQKFSLSVCDLVQRSKTSRRKSGIQLLYYASVDARTQNFISLQRIAKSFPLGRPSRSP
jgi:hypothetical protein